MSLLKLVEASLIYTPPNLPFVFALYSFYGGGSDTSSLNKFYLTAVFRVLAVFVFPITVKFKLS
jgi:hypothetical protein